MSDKPSIVADMVAYCFKYGMVLSALYLLSIGFISVLGTLPVAGFDMLKPMLALPLIGLFVGGLMGFVAGFYWGIPLGIVNLLLDYRQRPDLYKVVAVGLIIVQSIGLLCLFSPVTFNSMELLIGVALPVLIATCVAIYALYQYLQALDDYYRQNIPRKAKEKPKRKNSEVIASDYDAHALAMHADVTIREQEEQAS